MPTNPDRARASAEAKAVKRAADRAFAQPPVPDPPPPPSVRPRDWDVVPDPDSQEFKDAGYSTKKAPYNPFSPPVLRGEIRRRALEADKERYLKNLKEGSPEWIKLSLVIEVKHGGRAQHRIRALELLAKIEKMMVDRVEVHGSMTPEMQEAAMARALENFMGKVSSDFRVLPASAEIAVDGS